jgi:hypothetical protein
MHTHTHTHKHTQNTHSHNHRCFLDKNLLCQFHSLPVWHYLHLSACLSILVPLCLPFSNIITHTHTQKHIYMYKQTFTHTHTHIHTKTHKNTQNTHTHNHVIFVPMNHQPN